MNPHQLVDAVVDVDAASREGVLAGVRAVTHLVAWCEAQRVALAVALESFTTAPELVFAEAARADTPSAIQLAERSATSSSAPVFAEALADGRIAVEHLDEFGRGLRRLEPADRAGLAAQAERLLRIAEQVTPREFAKSVGNEVRRVQRDDGEARLTRQQRATRLRTWTDRDSGMWRMSGAFDPETALRLDAALRAMLEAKFAEPTPPGAPSDPIEKQDFLRAHALIDIINGNGVRLARPEFIVVVDTTTPGRPSVDWGLPIELPHRVLLDLFGRADVETVVVRNGVVLHAPGEMNLGRSTRLASRHQRRVLRALYATCAVPGCSVRFDNCKIHHVVWFRNGGATDLGNLLPVCSTHHHVVHEGGWLLQLKADRSLRITRPDGTVMSTGPPGRAAA